MKRVKRQHGPELHQGEGLNRRKEAPRIMADLGRSSVTAQTSHPNPLVSRTRRCRQFVLWLHVYIVI